jgi:glycine cleavage system H protein
MRFSSSYVLSEGRATGRMDVVPEELRYSRDHEWVRVEGDEAVVGITYHAQEQLGDIVYVKLPEVGTSVVQSTAFGLVESVKSASDLLSPLTGEVVAVNGALNRAPETINQDPYGEGWMIRVRAIKPDEMTKLLSAGEYIADLGDA